MERLTTDETYCQFIDCDADAEGCACDCTECRMYKRLQAYEQTGLEPETIREIVQSILNLEAVKGFDYLKSLVGADAAERLIVLPVAPGTTVYEVKNNTDACCTCRYFSSWFGTDAVCSNEAVDPEDRSYPNCAEKPICEKQFMEVVEYKPSIASIFNYRDQYGKTIFLTREEAEEALEKSREERLG